MPDDPGERTSPETLEARGLEPDAEQRELQHELERLGAQRQLEGTLEERGRARLEGVLEERVSDPGEYAIPRTVARILDRSVARILDNALELDSAVAAQRTGRQSDERAALVLRVNGLRRAIETAIELLS